jgi:UDP-N-acetylmuramate dehydrogenase
MDLREHHDIGQFTTFGLPAAARYYVRATTEADLRRALDFAEGRDLPVLLLGGGSNILFTKDFPGLVLHLGLRGLTIEAASDDRVRVRAAAGEDWPALVATCLQRGAFGLENLSLIPGTAGAAPVQNIGAYGVEIRELLESVEVLDRDSGQLRSLAGEECEFGYRDSIFRRDAGQRLVITGITLGLSGAPRVCLDYTALRDALSAQGIRSPDPQQVAEAVCALRRAKLPDPAVLGNAGSFFKNPVVPGRQADALKERHPDLVCFADAGGQVKLAAGWLIDRCGFRGQRRGRVGVHREQALVLVNEGGASADELLDLVADIRHAVADRFGVNLQVEPRLV